MTAPKPWYPCGRCGGPTSYFWASIRCDDPRCDWTSERPHVEPAPAPRRRWFRCDWCGCRLAWWRALARHCARCGLDGPPPCGDGERDGMSETEAWRAGR